MKDWLRSLLIPEPTAKPEPRKPRALPPPTQAAAGSAAKTAPAVSGAAKGAPAQQDFAKALDGRQAATILREMIRMRLKDPDYAARFAKGIKAMLRDGG